MKARKSREKLVPRHENEADLSMQHCTQAEVTNVLNDAGCAGWPGSFWAFCVSGLPFSQQVPHEEEEPEPNMSIFNLGPFIDEESPPSEKMYDSTTDFPDSAQRHPRRRHHIQAPHHHSFQILSVYKHFACILV